MGYKITTLMENHALKECLAAEHGLSLLVEGEGFRVLYDTGSTGLFLQNAEILGKDLKNLDALVFSHGHYDHTGGTGALFARGDFPAAVYLGNHFFDSRFSKKTDSCKDIGARVSEADLEEAGIRWNVIGKEPVKIYGPEGSSKEACKDSSECAPAEGMYLVSGFRTLEEMEHPLPNLVREKDGQLEQDPFEDEVALVLITEKNLCLVSGCTHIGIISLCRQIEQLFGRPVTMFVGGTHLMDADDLRIEKTCRLLKQRGIRKLGACHCNGEKAGVYFEKHFPGFFRNNTGSVVTVE